jgi:NADH-quinone oxidoreductase subunit J
MRAQFLLRVFMTFFLVKQKFITFLERAAAALRIFLGTYFDLNRIVLFFVHLFGLVFLVVVIFFISVPLLMLFVKFLLKTWFFFYSIILPLSAIFLALGVIFFQSPVNALLCLIGVFFAVIFFLLSLQIEFLSIIFLIIYIGAIAILFLFVIMMFNLKEITMSRGKSYTSKLSSGEALQTIGGLYVLLLIYRTIVVQVSHVVHLQYSSSAALAYRAVDLNYFITYIHSDINIFAHLLYTYYAGLFLLSGLVLLTAMLGSIVLALSTADALDFYQLV